jgi:hypothetical protein
VQTAVVGAQLRCARRPRNHYTPPTRPHHGTPIEQAPTWALPLVAGAVWLVTFPALVGILGTTHGPWGGTGTLALAAGAIASLITLGLARQKPWRRPDKKELVDSRPRFVRFTTWLITVAMYPSVLHGVLVLVTGGKPWPWEASLVVGWLVAAVQGVTTWWRTRPTAKETP